MSRVAADTRLERTVVISSCVGGGPMARLARRLDAIGGRGRVLSMFTPEGWRALMRRGALGRFGARLGSLCGFPLVALADALFRRGSVLVPTTNPFFLPFLLVFARPLHRQPVVALVYDLYPDALEASGVARIDGPLARLAGRANRFLFEHADVVVFIGERMGAHARGRYGEPRRWVVLETGADSAEFSEALGDPSPRTDLERWCEGKIVIGYVGNLGRVHDWDTFAEAVPMLLARVSDPVGVLVAASGPGVERLRAAWSDLPADRVRFEPPLGDESWARLLPRIDISVVTLRDAARHTSIPSKTFSAMAGGSAIAVIAPRESDVADVVSRHDCGLVLASGDPEAAAEALADLVRSPARLAKLRARAREALRSSYEMTGLARRWAGVVAEVRPPRWDAAKRSLDLAASLAGLALLGPALLGVALAVRVALGSPVLFSQERPGKRGRPFHLVKFRTMRHPRPGEEGPEADAARLTRLGRFLRATSIDELPTLFNVLRGDMSLVGPRPLLMRYLPRYSPRQYRRHEVKPGITGWAQVNGRNAITWEEKFELDVWYVEHRSFWLDLRILVRTLIKVFRREGVSREGHATMPEFFGSDPARSEAVEVAGDRQ